MAAAAANDGVGDKDVGDNDVGNNDVGVAMADNSGIDGGRQQRGQQWLS